MDTSLKQFGYTKSDILLNYLCHTWVSEDRLLLGTDTGKVQLFEMADLRNEFYANLEKPQKEKKGKRS